MWLLSRPSWRCRSHGTEGPDPRGTGMHRRCCVDTYLLNQTIHSYDRNTDTVIRQTSAIFTATFLVSQNRTAWSHPHRKRSISFKLTSSEMSEPVSQHHEEDWSFRYGVGFQELSILLFLLTRNRGSTLLLVLKVVEFRLTGELVCLFMASLGWENIPMIHNTPLPPTAYEFA